MRGKCLHFKWKGTESTLLLLFCLEWMASDRELVVPKGRWVGGWAKQMKGIKKYKLISKKLLKINKYLKVCEISTQKLQNIDQGNQR